MDRVELPPDQPPFADGSIVGGWWHRSEEQDRIICDLCPRECHLKPGDRGFCFVRENRDGLMALTTYGRSTGFCIDPIEKKPLNHFYPGTSVLSFGTAGCNLGCKFCQNWDISKSREIKRLSDEATPENIAEAAHRKGCHSVAFTYNDPVIWAEYAIDVADACHAVGVKTVAVTAGYITPQARGPFFQVMDAANVDLKGFTEEFYHRLTLSHLEPVLETLQWLKEETDVWFEITNLIIPRANDTSDEIRRLSDWVLEHVGDLVPVHFTAFHPDFRMLDRPRTPPETLLMAHEIARQQGLKYVYTGNVHDVQHQSTYCHHCGGLAIERDWYELGRYNLRRDLCQSCGESIPGRFLDAPGSWGRRRVPVQIADFSAPRTAREPSKGGTNMTGPIPARSSASEVKADFPSVERPDLTEQQQTLIHRAASRILAAEASHQPAGQIENLLGAGELTVMGAFVTLTRQDRLRGCCGMLGQPVQLLTAVDSAARRTAVDDPRLPPVSPTELPFLDLSVSLLCEFANVDQAGEARIDAIQIGRHGLQIRRGTKSGLLLPSVATDHGFDAKSFLQQVCHKAGLPVDAWSDSDTQLVTFEAVVIKAPFDLDAAADLELSVQPILSREELEQLADRCRQNWIAQARGGTPDYYIANVPDGMVQGLFLQLDLPGSDQAFRLGKLSLRPAFPLQSTLLNLTQAAANQLRSTADRIDLEQVQLHLTVMHDCAMHGTVDQPDILGIEPARRAVLLREGNQYGWILAPDLSPEQLIEKASSKARLPSQGRASVLSLAAMATSPVAEFQSTPQPKRGAATRPAAVAGTFYTADADDLRATVDDLVGNSVKKQQWPAALVPHAGLRFSGRIAADVLKQIDFPENILVIGPKHTALGVRWAVAPHQIWEVPGATIAGNCELAERLSDKIVGLEMDAAAHQREHAIEVELPLLHHLAPESKVVGIVMGGGNYDQCVTFADGLVSVIREMTTPPLLLISSDMNHFATETENRRLDHLAIEEMKQLSPEGLYETCTANKISMCGLLPAVTTLLTLRQLGGLEKCTLASYATSADISGDTGRVVGYAGMLFA